MSAYETWLQRELSKAIDLLWTWDASFGDPDEDRPGELTEFLSRHLIAKPRPEEVESTS